MKSVADISVFVLPNNTEYNYKDAAARAMLTDGTATHTFKNANYKYSNSMLTGTGTAGQDGSETVAYVPALWTFNLGLTPAYGDVITIKVPVNGSESGVWLSVDNGTTYYPVASHDKERLTTKFPVNDVLTLVYETGFVTKLYGNTTSGASAGSEPTEYTINRWRVMNFAGGGGGSDVPTDNPVFTGSITLDDTTIEEEQFQVLLAISSLRPAAGVSF